MSRFIYASGKFIDSNFFRAKVFSENDNKKIPFSVEGHHALMDGYHVALLLEKMQNFIKPSISFCKHHLYVFFYKIVFD